MRIVLFTHYRKLTSTSMPLFAGLLEQGFRGRGWEVEVWECPVVFGRIPAPCALAKWLGYLDQFVVFPVIVWRRLQRESHGTLFVFADQALGPWVPLVANRPHVVHCHDFLAQRSALGEVPWNRTSASGKIYQRLIRRGFRRGQNFISVSEATRRDLHRFYGGEPAVSEVVSNALNGDFSPGDREAARQKLGEACGADLRAGWILHVGGNQWYKNRTGVVEIYEAWRAMSGKSLPLLMFGPRPDANLMAQISRCPVREFIHRIGPVDFSILREAYRGAEALVFPSLAEGFGWPVAEAMACGCPVICPRAEPMSEVGRNAAAYFEPLVPGADRARWARDAAEVLSCVLQEDDEARGRRLERGLENVRRFEPGKILGEYERVYRSVLETEGGV
jgi:glycosyltransferase involved in cell wall biosynthesis